MDASVLIPMIVGIVVFGIVMIMIITKTVKTQLVGQTSQLDLQQAALDQKDAEISKKLEELKRQSQEIIANAQKEALAHKEAHEKQLLQEKAKVLAEAHQQADEVIKQADNARLALMADMNNKIDERAVAKAVDILSASIPENIRQDLHHAWFEALLSSSYEQLDRLKIPEGLNQVNVISAFALSDDQRKRLQDKLQEKLRFDITLTEQVDPAIIAGLVMSIGSLFMDGSLKFKIEEVARGQQQGG
jgi:F-type H+-transporting ATPase subunit delta